MKKLQKKIDELNKTPKTIKPKPVLVTEINNETVWKILGDFSQIMDVKSMITFVNIKLPERFHEAFEMLSDKFKLEDLRRELRKASGKEYHRNTYQNWLKFLANADLITLKNKTYHKVLTPKYKRRLLKRLEKL